MLQDTKIILNGEKVVRNINRGVQETFINQLLRGDIEESEKQKIAEAAKQMLAKDDKWEEENSDFWYKFGVKEGEIKGMIKAAGLFFVGYTIGAIFLSKK